MLNETGVTIHTSDSPRPVAPFINEVDKLQVERTTLSRNPGYKAFSDSYAKANALRPVSLEVRNRDWQKFIFHDIQTRSALFSSFTAGHSPEANALGSLASKYGSSIKEDVQLDAIAQMVRLPLSRNETFPKAMLDNYEEKLKRFRELFPAFHASAAFLLHPGDKEYQAMQKMRTPLKTVINYHFLPLDGVPDVELNGFETIIAFNFLKNAVDHCPKKREADIFEVGKEKEVPDTKSIRYIWSDDGFEVINNSNDAHPGLETLFQIKGKGENGGTGFGMFTAARLYAPLIGGVVAGEWTSHEADDKTTYSVKFSLKKSQPASTVSPLPQPVQ